MRIAVAQMNSVKGDIKNNINKHKLLIDLAVSHAAEIIIFPELSLTGYEPELAKELATHINDPRLNDFQIVSDRARIIIGIGVPVKSAAGISISMVIFQPKQERQLYSKKYLHADEEPFFVSGESTIGLIGKQKNVALAICYELSVPQHQEDAVESGAEIYIASVVKSDKGIDKALNTLSDIAKRYSILVLMSNAIGHADGSRCAGKTSIWNHDGQVLEQLNDTSEGVLMIDTRTQKIIQTYLYYLL